MNKWIWNFACAVSVMSGAFVVGCDDDSSASPQQDMAPFSSDANDLGLSSDGLPFSSASLNPISSAVVESSSSAAVPLKLCHFAMTTKTGYYPMAVITSVASVCLPLADCDTSLVNLGFEHCYEEQATVEGCFTTVAATEVEECDKYEKTCETPNGTAYLYRPSNKNCFNIVREN